MKPSFICKTLANGDEALRERTTGDRFILTYNRLYNQFAAYANGQLVKVGSRAMCLEEIERTASYAVC